MFIRSCWNIYQQCGTRVERLQVRSSIKPSVSTHTDVAPEATLVCMLVMELAAIRYVSQKERWTHGRLTYFCRVQAWTYHSGRLRHGSWCLAPPTPAYVGAQVITLPCSSSNDQLWDKLDRGQLRGVSVVHRLSNLCLDARNAQEITVQECHSIIDSQEFIFTRWECFPSSYAKKEMWISLKCTNCDTMNMLTINNALVIGRWSGVFFEGHEPCARPYKFTF